MSYSKERPYFAAIKEKINLCSPGSGKETHHIVIDLADSGLTYSVGDCVAVLPTHTPQLVEKTLDALKMEGSVTVMSNQGLEVTLEEYLTTHVNITHVHKALLEAVASRQSNRNKRDALEKLLADRAALKAYIAGRHLWDLLHAHHEVTFTPRDLSALLKPLLPRFYSIASSPDAVGQEAHLTVRKQHYEAHGYPRGGVCSSYLCDVAKVGDRTLPIYIHPHRGFTLPQDGSVPIVMIGPGTGVAPFRGFMQQRVAAGATGGHWLFFGDWTRSDHFLYGDYWRDLERRGLLRLTLAFSRDKGQKEYVQHRMAAEGEELYRWLEEGAYLYVCGDAQRMAKDVEQTLIQIVAQHGSKSDQHARDYVKQLRRDKRYLRDVY